MLELQSKTKSLNNLTAPLLDMMRTLLSFNNLSSDCQFFYTACSLYKHILPHQILPGYTTQFQWDFGCCLDLNYIRATGSHVPMKNPDFANTNWISTTLIQEHLSCLPQPILLSSLSTTTQMKLNHRVMLHLTIRTNHLIAVQFILNASWNLQKRRLVSKSY